MPTPIGAIFGVKADIALTLGDVRFWHKPDIGKCPRNVRYWHKADMR